MTKLKNPQSLIGISSLAYQLANTNSDLQELHDQGLLSSDVETLTDFGFRNCYRFTNQKQLTDSLIKTSRNVIEKSDINSLDIGFLILYSGLPILTAPADDPLELFNYPLSHLQHRLGLSSACPIALSQRGCSGLFAAIQLVSKLLDTQNTQSALIVMGDILPPTANREIMYNIISDASAAILVTKGLPLKNEVLAIHEVRQTYYHNTSTHEQELLAAYFPLAQRAISECLSRAHLTMNDIRWIVPHNVSLRSWTILAGMLGIGIGRVWTNNIARVGHTISCDQVINLCAMEEAGIINRGDKILLFTFGFGASWSVMVVRH